MKFLEDKSHILRRGSANLIGIAVQPPITKNGIDWSWAILPYQEPDKAGKTPKQDKSPTDPARKSKLLVPLVKLNVVQRLQQLRNHDAEPSVREAAGLALQRLAMVQEKKP